MTKEFLLKTFKEEFLAAEIKARDDYDFLLSFSFEAWINEIVEKIRNDEIKHIKLCQRAIKIIEKSKES